jgi:hypothetical protein
MALSNLPGVWRWEERDDRGWWRIHTTLNVEDGPHSDPPWLDEVLFTIVTRLQEPQPFDEDKAISILNAMSNLGFQKIEKVPLKGGEINE